MDQITFEMIKNQKNLAYVWFIILISILQANFLNLYAENNLYDNKSDDYKGLWLTEIKNEAIYLIIKKDNRASYFYKDRKDNTLYKGTWEIGKNKNLVVSSIEDGSLLFSRYLGSTSSTDSSRLKGLTLKKMPADTIGKWALPPDYKKQENKYKPSTYFGIWEYNSEENRRYIKILEDRSVFSVTNQKNESKYENILKGEWYKHGKHLHIAWEDGNYSIIDNTNPNKVRLLDYSPGTTISEESSEYKLITPVKDDKDKIALINREISNSNKRDISLTHFDYKAMLKFYRGDWITLDENNPNAVEIIKFSRFGKIELASNKKARGNWYLLDKGCLVNLDDGTRMKLKHIGSAFLVFIYDANRPLDGFPKKILKAAPKNNQKLEQLNQSIYFTSVLLEKVNPLVSNNEFIPLVSNWSNVRTINPPQNSPWWWPIWSDKVNVSETEKLSENNPFRPLTNETDSIASNKESRNKSLPNPMKLVNESKWDWPF